MPEITMAQVQSIPNPTVKAVADEIVQIARLAIEKATLSSANPAEYKIAGGASSFESIFSKRFQSLDPELRQQAEFKLSRSMARPSAKKIRTAELGRFGRIDLKKSGSVEQQVAALGPNKKLTMSKAQLESLATPLLGPAIPTSAAVPTVFLPGTFPLPETLYSVPTLELRLHSLRCVDETGYPWWFGSEPGEDEMDLGGTQIDAVGTTTAISKFRAGSSFDDGDVVTWNPPKPFAKFNLTKGTDWPKSYFVVFALAEIDEGGFPEFLDELVKKVAAEVKKHLGALIGSIIGSSGGLIGLLIGLVVGYAVDRIVEWLISVWEDDVFTPITVSVELASSRARWSNGSYISPEIVSRFTGHDGEYHLAFEWRLIPGPAIKNA